MNGFFSTFFNSAPFVISINSVQALSLANPAKSKGRRTPREFFNKPVKT